MVDVRGDVLRPPHGTTPAAVKSNKNQKWDPLRAMKTFKSFPIDGHQAIINKAGLYESENCNINKPQQKHHLETINDI